MRILYVFPEPLPLPKARAIQVVRTVAALADQGVLVDLAYVPVAGMESPFAHYGLLHPPGVRLVPLSRGLPGVLGRLRVNSNKFFQYRLLHWLKQAEQVAELPDFIFARHVKLACGLCKKLPDIPLVYEAHELFADTAPQKKAKALAIQERYVLEHAAGLISISSALATQLCQRYGVVRNIVLIPSAADIPLIESEKDWADANNHIVYAGSFFEWKGVDDLLAAAEFLPGCTINIIGGDADGIERLTARQPACGARINFLGSLPHADALKAIAQGCVAVLPNRAGSVSEFTSPLKLFEYMAAGCAIVSSNLPVFREVLKEGEVAWFEPGNPHSLAAAIQGLLSDRDAAQRQGNWLRIRAEDYSWDARASAIINMLPSVKIEPHAGL